MALNRVLLLGNLGKAPEVRYLESGRKVATFRLATSERYTDKNGQKQELTEWHNIVVWDKQADFAEKYLQQGAQIFLEGKLRTRVYQDKNNQEQKVTEVIAQSIQMCGRKAEGEQRAATPAQPSTPAPAPAVAPENYDDDLPF